MYLKHKIFKIPDAAGKKTHRQKMGELPMVVGTLEGQDVEGVEGISHVDYIVEAVLVAAVVAADYNFRRDLQFFHTVNLEIF